MYYYAVVNLIKHTKYHRGPWTRKPVLLPLTTLLVNLTSGIMSASFISPVHISNFKGNDNIK